LLSDAKESLKGASGRGKTADGMTKRVLKGECSRTIAGRVKCGQGMGRNLILGHGIHLKDTWIV